jgi:hypothetical protein
MNRQRQPVEQCLFFTLPPRLLRCRHEVSVGHLSVQCHAVGGNEREKEMEREMEVELNFFLVQGYISHIAVEPLQSQKKSEMPSSRPLCNKGDVPNADIMLLVATALALEPRKRRAGVVRLQVNSSATR